MPGGSLKHDDFSYEHRRGLQGFRSKIVEVTSAEILALFTTPKTLVPAPGEGQTLIFDELKIEHRVAGTPVAYGGIAAGEELVVKYENAAGAIASETQETTGWLDQTVGATKWLRRLPAVTAVLNVFSENKALVLHLLVGEITTGTGTLV